jgi:hypothetical protein
MLLIILLVLLFLFLFGGAGYGYNRYGGWGYSPVGLIIAILLIAWLFGAFS